MEWLTNVMYGIWVAWCSPEFDWLRLELLGFIAGAVVGYVAARDSARAAADDEWYADELNRIRKMVKDGR